LSQKLIELRKNFNTVSDPEIKNEIGESIKNLEAEIAAFKPKSNTFKIIDFVGGGFDKIDLSEIAPKDQVGALQERLSQVTVSQKILKDSLKINPDYSKLLEFDKLDEESKRIIELLERLGIEIKGTVKKGFSAEELQQIELFQDAADVAQNAFTTINDLYIASLDERLAVQEDRVNKATKIAEKGNIAQLELEEERLAKLQEKREKALTRQAAIDKAFAQAQIIVNTALTISNIQAAAAKAGAATGGIGVPIVLAVLSGLIASAANLFQPPKFILGTEKVKNDPQFRQFRSPFSSEGYNADFNGDERIFSGPDNQQIGNLTNKQVVEAAKIYRLNPRLNTDKIIFATSNTNDLKELKTEIRDLRESFENTKTQVIFNEKGLLIAVEKMIQKKVQRDRYSA
jgi:hypothetical protein